MDLPKKIKDIRQWDEARPGFVGEHWLVLGAGLLAMRQAKRSHSTVGRLVGTAVGTAQLARAATGRGGVAGVAGKLAGRPTLLSRLSSATGRR